MRGTHLALAIYVAFSSTSLATAAVLVLDDFSQGAQPLVSVGSGVNVQLTGNPAHLVGGIRSLQAVDFGNPFLPSSTVEINVGTGQLSYNRQQTGAMQTFYGSYVHQPINIDFIASGYDRFAVQIDSVPGPFLLRLGVSDNSFSMNSEYFSIQGNTPGVYEVPISSFDHIDFSKVGGFYLEIREEVFSGLNGPGVYTISSFAAVPEPTESGIAVAVCLAVFGIAIHARRVPR